jgi:hypothetical protein
LVLKVVKRLFYKIKRNKQFRCGGLFESITVFKFFAVSDQAQQQSYCAAGIILNHNYRTYRLLFREIPFGLSKASDLAAARFFFV